ncbi:MAG: SDR family NAD(P)-dependent oxidoreductase [Nocardioides sp.]|uniref:SDR family NAD(P)-dependent oxidoreductase n=1 Tax=Nocardioides sp. TaxID=35761 RepID=UPI003F11FDDF
MSDAAARFAGKRIVVTGAASGVGAALLERLRAEGARVVGADVTPSDGLVVGDLTDAAARAELVETVDRELGGLDVLCNVAGIQSFASIDELTEESLLRQLLVNTVAPIMLVKAFAPALRASRGNVVTISSISASTGQAYNTAYCASKAGVAVGMKALAAELAADGVRVNCVAPGGIDTPLIGRAAASMDPALDWSYVAARSQGVMGGMAAPLDVAEAVMFLASDAASSITATSLLVDRGTLL